MTSNAEVQSRTPRSPLLLYGLLLVLLSGLIFFLASGFATVCFLANHYVLLARLAPYFLLVGGATGLLGILLALYDLFVLLPNKRQRRLVNFDDIPNRQLTVVLTAYNDELSIGEAVRDFRGHPLVRRVIVVDNNSRDRTSAVAAEAGAEVVLEREPGYGKCVFRALTEGIAQSDTDLTLLCEGDGTFAAFDIDKFMAYIPHAEIVNGTRIVEQLRDRKTQLTTFMYYGNFAVGKLLELKYLGQGTFTDVGTTYKLCRNASLVRLLPELNPDINLEFNAHFLDTALANRISLVECPITFHKRIGVSKGGNLSDVRALRVGLRMIRGIMLSWKPA
jgi:cellulose synthase/poly-beta-1,6-N-acetylglucosamine synthase-like glycosyltransferase